jgi:hypothetical protein
MYGGSLQRVVGRYVLHERLRKTRVGSIHARRTSKGGRVYSHLAST